MRRHGIQTLIAVPLLAGGLLLSATLGHGTADVGAAPTGLTALAAAELTLESGRGRLSLEGTTASARHEAGLLGLASDQFAGVELQTEFRPGVVLTDSWESTSNRLLYLLAAAESGRAVMRDRSIEIRGVTADAETFAARVEFLRGELSGDTAVVTDVMTIESTASHDAMCRRAFSELAIEPIGFQKSSATIRTAAFGTLDRIVDFAYDCPQMTIAVKGHTDASGDESWNRRLSLARARAVAAHIAQRGVDPLRLPVSGLGSAQPIADNSTAYGRKRNRRIEFELR